jgi:hypothetical protein
VEPQMRLEEYGLTLRQFKPRSMEIDRFAASNRRERRLGAPDTFDFLGFTHVCGITGAWMLQVVARLRGKEDESQIEKPERGLQGNGLTGMSAKWRSGCGKWCEANITILRHATTWIS